MIKHLTASTAAVVVLLTSAVPFAAYGATMNRYGGPAYMGAPALGTTAALVKAGGGPGHFSLAVALASMVGPKLVNDEVEKLTKQYGKQEVTQWMTGFNFSVEDSLRLAGEAGVTLPRPPAGLHGKALAAAFVSAGVDPKTDVFWAGRLYDMTVTHKIHDQAMNDIDAKYGATTDMITHKISNQAMYDLAHALGDTHVRLASLH
jgi:hypothetical protein